MNSKDMPTRLLEHTVEWVSVLSVGFVVGFVPDYKQHIIRFVVTVISMGVGTVVSWYIKKHLRKK